MNYLIDTNVISELRKGGHCNPAVSQWYAGISETSLYLSTLVLGEVRKGIESLRLRDPKQSEALEQWLSAVKDAFVGRILPVDDEVSEMWGRLNAVRTLPLADSLLAATAKVHGMTLVTRDVKALAGLGLDLLDPFKPG